MRTCCGGPGGRTASLVTEPALVKKDRNDAQDLSGDLRDAIARGDTAYLLKALESAGVGARAAAVEGLGSVGGEQARLALLRIARDRWDQRPDIRIAALRALGKIVDADRYADLIEEFIAGDNSRVMTAARLMLRDVDPDGFPARLLDRKVVDHGAIRVYGTSRMPESVPLLSSFLQDAMREGDITSSRKWGKVFAAVKALGNIGGQASVKTIESLVAYLGETEPRRDSRFELCRLDKIRQAAEQSLAASDGAGDGRPDDA